MERGMVDLLAEVEVVLVLVEELLHHLQVQLIQLRRQVVACLVEGQLIQLQVAASLVLLVQREEERLTQLVVALFLVEEQQQIQLQRHLFLVELLQREQGRPTQRHLFSVELLQGVLLAEVEFLVEEELIQHQVALSLVIHHHLEGEVS